MQKLFFLVVLKHINDIYFFGIHFVELKILKNDRDNGGFFYITY